jgi:hypothetical protein
MCEGVQHRAEERSTLLQLLMHSYCSQISTLQITANTCTQLSVDVTSNAHACSCLKRCPQQTLQPQR